MCVKEFLGYNCGHCSVPFVRQCPLSLSNPIFPICQLPADRPLFVNEPCHPCSRVVWNAKVLKEEEEHKERHQRGECGCEVIFDQEERERRMRLSRNKGKGKAIQRSVEGRWKADEERTDTETVFSESAEDARIAAYRYVGYYVELTQPTFGPHEHLQAMGHISQSLPQPHRQVRFPCEYNPAQQSAIKWHPEMNLPAHPAAASNTNKSSEVAQPYLGRSSSAPAEIFANNKSMGGGDRKQEPQQPMIVTSDLGQHGPK